MKNVKVNFKYVTTLNCGKREERKSRKIKDKNKIYENLIIDFDNSVFCEKDVKSISYSVYIEHEHKKIRCVLDLYTIDCKKESTSYVHKYINHIDKKMNLVSFEYDGLKDIVILSDNDLIEEKLENEGSDVEITVLETFMLK